MTARALHLSFAFALAVLPAAAVAAPETHAVKVSETKATVGAKGKTSVTLVGKNGWHLNEEFPVALKLAPGAGVTVDKAKLDRKDLAASTKDSARFDVAFTASEPGRKTIDAEATFAVCQEEACKPVKEKVVLALDVAPAAVATPPAAAPAKGKTKGKGKAPAREGDVGPNGSVLRE
jgi:hypothetical protein